MSKAVICIVKTQLQAEAIVTRLRGANLPTADISLILVERAGMLGLARDRDSALSGRRQQAAHGGDPVGGVLGMLTGIGIVTIRGAGSHISAGPLMAALGIDSAAGVPNTLAEALVLMGCQPARADQYEQLVKQGNLLLAVQTQQSEEVRRATAILLEARAEDISVSEEVMRADPLS